MSGWTCGSTMWALKRTSDHPLPNGHDSLWTFDKPHSPSFLTAQSPACRNPGDPVTRGPYTSASQMTCSMACDRASPSSRIAEIIAASSFSATCCCACPAAAATAPVTTATMSAGVRRFTVDLLLDSNEVSPETKLLCRNLLQLDAVAEVA